MKRNAMPHLAGRLFGTPLAIEPRKLEVILTALGPRILGLESVEVDLGSSEKAALPTSSGSDDEASYELTADGVAIINVHGSLVQRSGFMDAMSGLTSYTSISESLRGALANDFVNSILLSIDSPGGEVGGLFDLAEEIYNARGSKRIVAVASDMACSAAYLLASAADEFYTSEAGVVGSIGVVMAHMDTSGAEEKAGIRVTHIHAGARKVDGSPHKPLDEESRAALQSRIDALYGLFTAKVARNRGIAEESVKGTEAGVYIGAEAVGIGLVDGIRSAREALADLVAGVRPAGIRNTRFAAISAADNAPTSGDQEEVHMDPKKSPEAGAEVAVLAAEVERLKAENAKLAAKAEFDAAVQAAAKESEKTDMIEAAMSAGKVTPAMLPALKKMAAHMDAKELADTLAGLSEKTHKAASGVLAPEKTAGSLSADEKTLLGKLGISASTVEIFGRVRQIRASGSAILDDGSVVSLKDLNSGRA